MTNLRDYLEENYITESIEDKGILKAVFMAGTPGAGKAQSLDSKILTIDGWKEMKDIEVGEKVITPKGDITDVVAIHPQGKKELYKVKLYDGRETKCCLDHLWKVHGFSSKKNSQKKNTEGKKIGIRDWTIKSTKELYEKQNLSWLKGRLHLPRAFVEFPKKSLKIEPYLLGVLLGDGCLKQGRVSFCTEDREIVERIGQLLHKDYRVKQSNNDFFINMKEKKINPHEILHFYRKELTNLGLYDKFSYEKFIPEEYKNSSKEDRWEILKGLMDTDGYASKSGQIYFYTTSKKLCEDFRYIVWSLGDNTILHEKQGNFDGKSYRKYYALTILSHNPENYFNLKRKFDRANIDMQKRNPNHNLKCRIDSIDYYGKEEAKCITVRDEEGLYITDDFIVTHNSYVLKRITSGQVDPRIVNTDTWTEFFMGKEDIDPEFASRRRDELTKNQLVLFLNSLLPLWVDGTSSNPSSLFKRNGILKSVGYDTAMIWVDTPLEDALKRNKQRKRQVDEDFIKKVYKKAQSLKPYYAKEFKNFTEILNGTGELLDKVVIDAFKKMESFYLSPVENPIGSDLIEEMREKGHKYLIDTEDYSMNELKSLVSSWYKQ